MCCGYKTYSYDFITMFYEHPKVSLYIYSSIKFVTSYFNQNVTIFPEEIKGRKIKLPVKFPKSNEQGEKISQFGISRGY